MKIKKWMKYILDIIVIYVLIALWGRQELLFSSSYYRFNEPSLNINGILSLLLGISTGIFLGLEHFIDEMHSKGKWKIRLPKLVLFGLPSFYLSLTKIFLYSGYHTLWYAAVPSFTLFNGIGGFVVLFQMILGYIIITSFYKKSVITEDDNVA